MRSWLSAALFLLVVIAFVMPFASTSCTLPGGFGRGALGSSTIYRGVDIALDAVPAVSPANKPARDGALPNDGQLGFEPFALLALLAAIAGIPMSLWFRSRGPLPVAGWALMTLTFVVVAQLEVARELTDRIASSLTQPLPPGKTASSYVGTGLGFLAALALLLVQALLNGAAALWASRRPASR